MSRNELQRIEDGPESGQEPCYMGVDRYRAYCNGNAPEVLARTREVMVIVVGQTGAWPSLEQWRLLLPKWFVDSCADEMSEEQAKTWMDWWYNLPDDERQEFIRQRRPWMLSAFLHQLDPARRRWHWWNAEVLKADLLVVEIEMGDWILPTEALEWLLRAAGAVRTEPE